jgi:C-terminal processing protease CtpA/Prc
MRVLNQWKLLVALSAALLPASLARAQNAPETKPDAGNPPPATAPAQPTDAAKTSTESNSTTQSSAPAASATAPSASAEVNTTPPSASANANVQTPPAAANLNATTQSQTPAAPSPPASNQPSATAGANSTQLNANVNAQTNLNTNLNANTQINQQNLTAGLQFGQPTAQGLALTTIDQNNIFYSSGLRQGDVIVSYNGQPIRSQADFTRFVTYVPGQRVPIVVLRNGQQQTLFVTYQAGAPLNQPAPPTAFAGAFLGVTFEPNPNAAIVRAVTPGSPAEHAGLKPGDMIVALNGNRVASSQQVTQIVSSMQPGERLDIEFARRTHDRAQAVLAARPGAVPLTARAQPAAPDTNVVAPERRTTEPLPGGRVGDTDRDGRVLDRDGAINRRGRLIPPRD